MKFKRFLLILAVLAIPVFILVAQFYASKLKTSGKNNDIVENFSSQEFVSSISETTVAEIVFETRKIPLKVLNNTLEYEFEAILSINEETGAKLTTSFYDEGVSVVREVGEEAINELGYIGMDVKEEDIVNSIIVYMNPKYEKAYITFRDSSQYENSANSTIYSFSIKGDSIKKLFSEVGNLTELNFTREYEYAGFSYNDDPSSSKYQESSLLQIIDCKNDEFIINASRIANGNIIGSSLDNKYFYDIVFIQWHSDTVVKLNIIAYSKDSDDSRDNDITGKEILYDVVRDIFVNSDGSKIEFIEEKPSDEELEEERGEDEHEEEHDEELEEEVSEEGTVIEEGNGDEQVESDSEAVIILKEFYTYLHSDSEYIKAMELLDDSFKLRMEILSQLGITELSKGDIDADEATIYANILRNTSIERVEKEELNSEIAKVFYYQVFDMGDEDKFIQPLIAQLKKDKGTWKITLIEDNKEDEN